MNLEPVLPPEPSEQLSFAERIQRRIDYHTGVVEELIIFRDKYANCALKDIAPKDLDKIYMAL